ncbi:hypothetical protein Q664_26325 [Archangium violaceum Cb vi76]|uniref:Uncharacterized protein n=2 Tax=Archangium violaceum TaxID=83451 RepID=A0A084SQL9_9BACT|nr:hypothetical protein Q664_26325 [Archangium violaceum Cb vi76]
MGMGEQSLTPGEQRILVLMEQGQQRLEQRLQSLEDGQKRTGLLLGGMDLRLTEVTLKVDQEIVNSKVRDRQLAAAIQELREEQQERGIRFLAQIERSQQMTLEAVHQEMNKLRSEFSKRFDQHDTRLEVVEQTLERHDERLHGHGQAIQGFQQEMSKLTVAVEHLTQAPQVPASP